MGLPRSRTTFVQCAWAAKNKQDSYLEAQFYRNKAAAAFKKAIMAVAASILTATFFKQGRMY